MQKESVVAKLKLLFVKLGDKWEEEIERFDLNVLETLLNRKLKQLLQKEEIDRICFQKQQQESIPDRVFSVSQNHFVRRGQRRVERNPRFMNEE